MARYDAFQPDITDSPIFLVVLTVVVIGGVVWFIRAACAFDARYQAMHKEHEEAVARVKKALNR